MDEYLMRRLGSEDVEALRDALERISRAESGEEGSLRLDDAVSRRLGRMLEQPGVDLAIELWAGPGSFDRLLEALRDGSRE